MIHTGHHAVLGREDEVDTWLGCNEYRIFVGNRLVKCPLAKTRLRWQDNIKMDLRKEVVRKQLRTASSGWRYC
jgi:hypothetical protein